MELVLLVLSLSAINAAPITKENKCIGILNDAPMPAIPGFKPDTESIAEFNIAYKVFVLAQAVRNLLKLLQESLQISSIPYVYTHPCNSAVERILFSASGPNKTEMLAEDYFLLMNLTRLLNESITYDTDYHYGAFVPCLEQALKQLGDITGGLSDMLNISLVQHEFYPQSNSTEFSYGNNTAPPAELQIDHDPASQCIQLQSQHQILESELCRCSGVVTSDRDEYKNVFEVMLGLNALYVDLSWPE